MSDDDGDWAVAAAPRRGKKGASGSSNSNAAKGRATGGSKVPSATSVLDAVRQQSATFDALSAPEQQRRVSTLGTTLLTVALQFAATPFARQCITSLVASHSALAAQRGRLDAYLSSNLAVWRARVSARHAAAATATSDATTAPAPFAASEKQLPSAEGPHAVSLGSWRADIALIYAFHASASFSTGTDATAASVATRPDASCPADAAPPAPLSAFSRLHCAGIGVIATAPAAQLQLALFLLCVALFAGPPAAAAAAAGADTDATANAGANALAQQPTVAVEVYDPILTRLEVRVLTHFFGLSVPADNSEARVLAPARAPLAKGAGAAAVDTGAIDASASVFAAELPVLVYLPHCGLGLTSNAIHANCSVAAAAADTARSPLWGLVLLANDLSTVLTATRFPALAPSAQSDAWLACERQAATVGAVTGARARRGKQGAGGAAAGAAPTAEPFHFLHPLLRPLGALVLPPVPAPAAAAAPPAAAAAAATADTAESGDDPAAAAPNATVEAVAAFRASLAHQQATDAARAAAAAAAAGDAATARVVATAATTALPWLAAARVAPFTTIAPLSLPPRSGLENAFGGTAVHTFEHVPAAVAAAPLPTYRVSVSGAASTESGGGVVKLSDPEIIPATLFP